MLILIWHRIQVINLLIMYIMRKLKIFPVIFLLVIMSSTSCKKPDLTYNGPAVVEFAPLTTSSTYTTAFSATIKQANYTLLVDTLELTVNLVGKQQNKDINVEYSLVTDKVVDFPSVTYFIDPTTAVEGTHFSFLPVRSGTANGVMTIPANSSFGKIKLNSIAAQVSPDVSKRVVIKLISTSDVNVNPNYQYFIVIITRV
jgi:hypothetical protein